MRMTHSKHSNAIQTSPLRVCAQDKHAETNTYEDGRLEVIFVYYSLCYILAGLCRGAAKIRVRQRSSSGPTGDNKSQQSSTDRVDDQVGGLSIRHNFMPVRRPGANPEYAIRTQGQMTVLCAKLERINTSSNQHDCRTGRASRPGQGYCTAQQFDAFKRNECVDPLSKKNVADSDRVR